MLDKEAMFYFDRKIGHETKRVLVVQKEIQITIEDPLYVESSPDPRLAN